MNILDIIGPVMIGPSSSHTAGAARIGRIARQLLGEEVSSCDAAFHGSFAKTWKGHGTDRAVAGGLMDLGVGDEQLRESLELAEKAGMHVTFRTIRIADAHPNTMVLHLSGKSGKGLRVQASSLGGGRILVEKINGLEAGFSGDMPTLIVQYRDFPGMIAFVSSVLAGEGINIATMRVFRSQAGGDAMMVLELDGIPSKEAKDTLSARQNIDAVTMIDRLQ